MMLVSLVVYPMPMVMFHKVNVEEVEKTTKDLFWYGVDKKEGRWAGY
jgi:hypothetical protein